MFKIKQDTAPAAFPNDFREISHRYPTEFSESDKVLSVKPNFVSCAVSSIGVIAIRMFSFLI